MRRYLLALAALPLAVSAAASDTVLARLAPGADSPASPASARQKAMAEAVNRYRQSRGLERLPLSASLSRVAQAHLADLEANHRPGGRCNMHSWSPRGDWTPCCYTPDHAQAACMWNKPKELTGGAYSTPGYEIVAHYSEAMTPAMAVEIWRDSAPHDAMVLNRGTWARSTWRAMGAAFGRHYAVVWFGESADPAGN